jgi:hypothetical protein
LSLIVLKRRSGDCALKIGSPVRDESPLGVNFGFTRRQEIGPLVIRERSF